MDQANNLMECAEHHQPYIYATRQQQNQGQINQNNQDRILLLCQTCRQQQINIRQENLINFNQQLIRDFSMLRTNEIFDNTFFEETIMELLERTKHYLENLKVELKNKHQSFSKIIKNWQEQRVEELQNIGFDCLQELITYQNSGELKDKLNYQKLQLLEQVNITQKVLKFEMKYMHNDNPGFQEVRAIYKGDLDIQLKKHGFGKMVYLMENESYEGQFVNDKRNGLGENKWTKEDNQYKQIQAIELCKLDTLDNQKMIEKMASEHTTEMTRLDIWECIKMIRDMDKVSIMILILNSIKLNEINQFSEFGNYQNGTPIGTHFRVSENNLYSVTYDNNGQSNIKKIII